MQSFTDHYAEWGIPSDASLDLIKKKLSELYNDWTAQKLNAPEEATLKLHLLDEAQKVFKDEASRRQYDRDLAESKNELVPIDHDSERLVSFQKWCTDAEQYYKNQQFDLAKTAIEKAFSYYDTQTEDHSFYREAALIYKENDDFSPALNYINQAIVFAPEMSEYDITKFLILEAEELFVQRQSHSTKEQIEKIVLTEKSTLGSAMNKAIQLNNQSVLALAYDFLSFVWCYKVGANEIVAEDWANKALALNMSSSNALTVLAEIRSKRSAAEESSRREHAESQRKRSVAEESLRREQAERARQSQVEEIRNHNIKISQEVIGIDAEIRRIIGLSKRAGGNGARLWIGIALIALSVLGVLGGIAQLIEGRETFAGFAGPAILACIGILIGLVFIVVTVAKKSKNRPIVEGYQKQLSVLQNRKAELEKLYRQ